jgi:hypothetical protein
MGEDPPAAVVSYVAEQLGITPGAFASYARRIPTRFEHSHRVAKYLGVRAATRDDRRATLLAAAEAASATESGLSTMTAVVNELRRRGALAQRQYLVLGQPRSALNVCGSRRSNVVHSLR